VTPAAMPVSLDTDASPGVHVRSPSGWRARLVDAAVLAAPVVVGGLSGVSTIDGVRGWYRTLEKPSWNPPDWVFGPVWTLLYVAMGVALVKVWRSDLRRGEVRLALVLFAFQLVLNFGWSWIFFSLHAIGPAFVEIVALLIAILATLAAFARVKPSAAALLAPYLGWVSFATVLNATIWQLNR
jgi:benzodiazapine receptor